MLAGKEGSCFGFGARLGKIGIQGRGGGTGIRSRMIISGLEAVQLLVAGHAPRSPEPAGRMDVP